MSCTGQVDKPYYVINNKQSTCGIPVTFALCQSTCGIPVTFALRHALLLCLKVIAKNFTSQVVHGVGTYFRFP
mgnify:CR=1 FL=1